VPAVAAVVLVAVFAPLAPAQTVVAPGTVVRWSVPGATSCGMAGERWEPVGAVGDEVCLYAVDLLREPGPLNAEAWVGGARRTAVLRVEGYPYEVQHIEIADEGKVNLSPADLARANRESARVGELWGLRSARRFTLPLAPPLEHLPKGGRFGARRFFNGEPRSPHTGVDYRADPGTPVLSVAAGTVVLAEEHFFSGKSVFVDHGDGLISMYFHLSGLAVQAGDEVGRGEVLGLVGSTGRATGPHLHFGLRWHGARIDPAFLLEPVAKVPAVGLGAR
jgi:murein DD-endopeptidase MepM/ murein hydrolase activator NlpD